MAASELPVVLITGSAGFLGQAIARALLPRYRVIGLDVKKPDRPPRGVDTVILDLTADEKVAKALSEVRAMAGDRIASVIHLAAYYDVTGEDNPLYDKVTVQGTRRLVDALQDLEVGQFVFSSTMLVHAPSPEKGRPINEDSPLEPAWAYPASKAETEALLRERHGRIPTVVLRLAGVYDEDCRAAFIAQQIARIFERLPTAYLFAGDITAGQPYLHLDDMVDAVVRTVDRRDDLSGFETFLIGEEHTPSYRDMQTRIGELVHGQRWRTLVLPRGPAKLGAWVQENVLDQDVDIRAWMIDNSGDHYELDTSCARAILGWTPKHRLIDTLPEMIRRLKADPTDWYGKNKLDPEPVAASEPELEQAKERLKGPLERSEATVQAELREHHRATLWAPFAIAALGLWLVASPFLHGLFDAGAEGIVQPALGHDLAPADRRNARLGLSEIVSGLLLVFLGFAALRRRLQWATAGLGLWIMLAPLVFWTTSPAAYGSDTLVGILVVVFAVLIPPTPGIAARALAADDDRPLGWTYSPSAFSQRIPIIALAVIGFLLARYMAAYQLGHIDGLWDPFFGAGAAPVANGSEAVVTSWVSKGFPIADAGFGAFTYVLDVLAGAIGDRRRWRTMPWMVFLFGLLVVPLGAVSVSFIIIQPPLIGTLCTLCLIQAAITVALIPYSVDEVLATCQYLLRAKRAGEPFWRTFWRGGPALSENQTPEPDLGRPALDVLREFLTGGVNYPWSLAAAAGIGVVLMLSPLLSGAAAPLYFSDHIAGCLAILVAVTAMAEIVRAVRFVNVALGAWVAASPFLLEGAGSYGPGVNVVLGLALIAVSLPRGTRSEEHYGGWDRLIV